MDLTEGSETSATINQMPGNYPKESLLYLIDFSFKFSEIELCTLLMNWFIWEKVFIYFCNKFRPVNCMHYIKYDVNSSLLSYFWLLQDCGTLDHCFITTHIIQKEGDLQIYFGVILLKTRHHTQAHITSGAFIHCALSMATRRT